MRGAALHVVVVLLFRGVSPMLVAFSHTLSEALFVAFAADWETKYVCQ
jgi:hypothetical protein